MKRKVMLAVGFAIALAAAAGPASAIGEGTRDNGYWGCIISGELDQSLCLRDPLPSLPRVPVPALPGLPI